MYGKTYELRYFKRSYKWNNRKKLSALSIIRNFLKDYFIKIIFHEIGKKLVSNWNW